jgi:tubulin epsilon
MVREMVTIQVGQCGNQLGRLFWQQALAEHSVYNQDGVYDDAMSSFFRNVDARGSPAMHHEQQQQGAFGSSNHGGPLQELPLGDGTGAISSLKARAVLVDTEGSLRHSSLIKRQFSLSPHSTSSLFVTCYFEF